MADVKKPRRLSAIRKDLGLSECDILHERWMEYTEEEVNAIKRDHCLKHRCPYMLRLGLSEGSDRTARDILPSNKYCDYLELTHSMRETRPELCDHWKDKVQVVRAGIGEVALKGVN